MLLSPHLNVTDYLKINYLTEVLNNIIYHNIYHMMFPVIIIS